VYGAKRSKSNNVATGEAPAPSGSVKSNGEQKHSMGGGKGKAYGKSASHMSEGGEKTDAPAAEAAAVDDGAAAPAQANQA